MLAVQMKKQPIKKINKEDLKKEKPLDIVILVKENDIEETMPDGSKLIKTSYKKVNITKQTNETAKLIKRDAAIEKLEELKKAIEKEYNKK